MYITQSETRDILTNEWDMCVHVEQITDECVCDRDAITIEKTRRKSIQLYPFIFGPLEVTFFPLFLFRF